MQTDLINERTKQRQTVMRRAQSKTPRVKARMAQRRIRSGNTQQSSPVGNPRAAEEYVPRPGRNPLRLQPGAAPMGHMSPETWIPDSPAGRLQPPAESQRAPSRAPIASASKTACALSREPAGNFESSAPLPGTMRSAWNCQVWSKRRKSAGPMCLAPRAAAGFQRLRRLLLQAARPTPAHGGIVAQCRR